MTQPTRHGRSCSVCGFTMYGGEHMRKYDAYWCKACDRWMDPGCGDPGCGFCAGRPEKPSMVPEAERRAWDEDPHYDALLQGVGPLDKPEGTT